MMYYAKSSHTGNPLFFTEYLKRITVYSAMFFAVFAIAPATHARPIVSALFTGASPEIETTGIATLNATLEQAFGTGYLGDVFNPLQVLQARNFVQDSTSAGGNPAVVSIGFSIGAESVKNLASLLYPANLTLAILIDAVLPSGDTLPANVDRGINFFQIGGVRDFFRTGEIGNFISGENDVGPADRVVNRNVEELVENGTRITHTSIDDNRGLHGLIVSELSSFSYDYLSYHRQQTWQVFEPSTLALFGVGALGLLGLGWRRGQLA